jgi:putative tricarboxylic transport membrane protein
MIAAAQNGIGTYFFTGTLNLTMIAIVVGSIAYSVWLELKNRQVGGV